jgi:DNA-binding response OmpR family regulator
MNDEAKRRSKVLLVSFIEDLEMEKISVALAAEKFQVLRAAYDDMLNSISRHYPLDSIIVEVDSSFKGALEKCRQLRLQKKYNQTLIIFVCSSNEEDMTE